MTRAVYTFGPTWQDRSFKKEFKRLPADRRNQLLEELASLIDTLAACTHPTADQRLATYRPSAYQVPGLKGALPLYEYRLKKLTRVIAGWHGDGEAVLMVAVTLSHDHNRLKRLIQGQTKAVGGWAP